MAAPVDTTATLKSLVSVANSKIEPKILTDRNYEVLSIKPLRSTTSPHNTVAQIQIDLAADSPIAIVSSDRYSRRQVEFTRIELKDVAKFREIEMNDKGQFVGAISDVQSAIDLLKIKALPTELTLIITPDATVVKAVEDSLGFVGAITFAGASGTGESGGPELVPVELAGIVVDGPASVAVNGTAQFTIVATPQYATVPNTAVWSSLNGATINATGEYFAGAEAGEDVVTVTITLTDGGTMSADHMLTITPAV